MRIKSLINKCFFEPFGYRFIKLERFSKKYNRDDLYTDYNCDFIKDPRFEKAFHRGEQAVRGQSDAHWRVYIGTWVASQAARLDGDFVECGVNTGFLSTIIMEYLNWNSLNKKFYLFDTFCGLDESLVSDEEKAQGRMIMSKNLYSDCYQKAVENFKEYKNAIIVRGSVPGTLTTHNIPKVSYLSIDMNCVTPEIAAANHFWNKMVPGGMILLDDYGHPSYSPQKVAFDQFAIEKGIEILSLPTGQGLIIKSKS